LAAGSASPVLAARDAAGDPKHPFGVAVEVLAHHAGQQLRQGSLSRVKSPYLSINPPTMMV
jgi:hypothetical protein